MADSPVPADGSVVRLAIRADGSAIDDTLDVLSVEVRNRMNRVPWARLVLFDGDAAEQDFPVSASSTFVPGTAIEIAAGYGSGGDEEVIFSGIIVRHGVRIGVGDSSRLEVECQDPAVAMTIGRTNKLFTKMSDGDIISAILGDYSGLTASVTAPGDTYDEMLQYYCTDWDFVVARAEAAGCLVSVSGGTVQVEAPNPGQSAVLSVSYGETLMEFHAELDARTQLSTVSASAWDPKTQAQTEATGSPPTPTRQGNLTSSDLNPVSSPDSFRIQTSATLTERTLQGWADARQLKAELARIQGRMRFQGNAAAVPGCVIELGGVGARFDGNVLVTGVRHEISEGGWTTEAEFGLSVDWITERVDVVAPPASGWTPGVEGLQIGVVLAVNASPDQEPKVQVKLPALGEDTDGVWARCASLHATDGAGVFFRPDIDDEVVVGFLANDPTAPVVLGGLYSSARAPAEDWEYDQGNVVRSIVTPEALTLRFDDEKKVLSVETPGGHSIVLSDEDESIAITDSNENSLTLDSDGITLKSPKDIVLEATGTISLKATADVKLEATGDLSGTGTNVKLSANASLTAQGNASAELSAAGQTTVKGAMVMIN